MCVHEQVIDKWTYHRFVRNISTSNLRIVREEYQGVCTNAWKPDELCRN